MPCELRIAAESDVALLLDLMEPFNAFEQTPWDRVAKERALRTLLKDPNLGVVGLVHELESVVAYFVVTWGYDLEWDGRDAFLTELFVVPGARGRGVGRETLAFAEATAKAQGARALHLMVRDENRVARGLYESRGYTSPPRLFLSKAL